MTDIVIATPNDNALIDSPAGDLLERATKYADAGLRSFPIPYGTKIPSLPAWQTRATIDPTELAEFFPAGSVGNIGIALGRGIVALDVDKKSGGFDTLPALLEKHGALPSTPTQFTGNGGLHFLFRVPAGVELSNRTGFRPGLDLKSTGGQIVAAPSVNEAGRRYQWREGQAPGDIEIADMPSWLLEILMEPKARKSAFNEGGPVKEGGRNTALTRYAGLLRARGAELEELRVGLTEMNATFAPPLELAEVESVLRSAMKWPVGTPRYAQNDAGLAERFVDEVGCDVRYVADDDRWLIWNGNIWEPDATNAIVRLFMEMGTAILKEAEAIPAIGEDKAASKAREKALSWARQVGEHKRIQSALKVAASDKRVILRANQLDDCPGYLPVANGIVDLTTGCLLASSKERLITRSSPIAFRPAASCSRFQEVIDRALPGEYGSYMQRVLGYALSGTPSEQTFYLLRGAGADSKSTLARVLVGVLGELASRPAGETFLSHDNDSGGGAPRADLMAFRGRRLVIASEPDSRRKFDKEMIKRVTGQDGITARAPYGRTMVEFEMTGTILMLANHLPAGDEADDALWRRLKLIPFDHPVPEHQRDPRLVESLLTEEAEGILAWLVRGSVAYFERGLGEPDCAKRRNSRWRYEVGTVAPFVDERCIRDGSVPLRELHRSYRSHYMIDQIHPVGLHKFGERLRQLGFAISWSQVKGKSVEVVEGLRLAPPH